MKIKRVLNSIEMVIKIICLVFIGVIVIIIFYAVIMRYVFHRPPSWYEELSRFMFIWLTMLGAALVTRDNSHVSIKFFVDYLPEKLRFVWDNIIRLLIIGFCGLMIQQECRIYAAVSEATSSALEISMGWVYLSVPIAGFLMGIYFLEQIVKSIVDRLNPAPAERDSL